MKVVVLYEELAEYFVNCLNFLANNYDCTLLVFCKKINPHAPFEFNYIHPNITIKNRENFSTAQLIEETNKNNPDAIFIGGWMYKPYLSVVKKTKLQNCILAIDNQWNGSLKQILGCVYFRATLKRHIKSIFVPGKSQLAFANRLGFKTENSSLGFYSCDYIRFHQFYVDHVPAKKDAFPKRFLFVGRYAKEKGINDLWEAFIEIKNEIDCDWELWCVGTGDINPIKHPSIKHFGFMQPSQLETVIKNSGVFVLPSTFDPWGVVVHEFASAGFPLICSNKVGATEAFLKEGSNGFIFAAGDKTSLKAKLKTFIEMSNQELNLMSENSAKISANNTPEIWANNFMKLSGNGKN